MSDKKVLTKEIAEEIISNFAAEGYVMQVTEYDSTLDLSDFTRIEDGVGEFLTEYISNEVICDEPSVRNGLLDANLDLSGLTDLSFADVLHLVNHKGDLNLNGVTEISFSVAQKLSTHYGGTLYLEGLNNLSNEAATVFCRHPDLRLTLENMSASVAEILGPGSDTSVDEIAALATDMWTKLSSNQQTQIKRILHLGGNALTQKIAEEFIADEDSVDLSEFTTIEDTVAKSLSKHEVSLSLGGLKELSDAAAESLSKHKGDIELNGLTSLSEAAAESLSKHEGRLYLDGLTSLSDAAAESLSKHENLSLNALTSLSDAAAESLSKHEGWLGLQGLTKLSDAAAESLCKHETSFRWGHIKLDNLPPSAAQILRDAWHGE